MTDQTFLAASVSDDDAQRFAVLAANVSYYWQILRDDWKVPDALAHELVRDWHAALLDRVDDE